MGTTLKFLSENTVRKCTFGKGKYLIKAEVVEYAKKFGTWPSGGAVINA